MNDEMRIVSAVLALILVLSAFMTRRIPMRQTLRMAIGWLGVFAILFVIFSFRSQLKPVWLHLKDDLAGFGDQRMVGDKIELKRHENGHFMVRAQVNGGEMDFLIDTGASLTSVNPDDARRTGVRANSGSLPVLLSTANGDIVAERATIDVLRLEQMSVRDHHAVIIDNLGPTNILGMNFLNELKSWRVEGDVMILEPYQQ